MISKVKVISLDHTVSVVLEVLQTSWMTERHGSDMVQFHCRTMFKETKDFVIPKDPATGEVGTELSHSGE